MYSGELSSEVEHIGVTFDEVLHAAGRVLGHNSACEMIGDVLFLGTDGQWYTLTVEAVMAVADPDYVRDSLLTQSRCRYLPGFGSM